MSQYEEYLDNDELEIDLLKLIKALWKKAWLIVLAAVIFGGAMFAYGKSAYVPTYKATTTLYASYISNQDLAFGENSGSISENSLSNSRSLVDTCIAVLNTRMTLEGVIAAADLNMPYTKLAGMISTEVINKTELFNVSITGTDPEEAALIANTIAAILPENVAMVNGSSTVGVIDTALVPASPVANSIAKNAVIAAVLGAMLVCGVVVVKEIYIDWKAAKGKKKEEKSN